jgi:gamma-glutamyltranspeptidase / glutathione hydrolase
VPGIGSPGGKRIPAILAQVMIDFIHSEQSLQTAIDNPRFYVERDFLFIEENIPPSTK